MEFKQWNGFKGGDWKEEINVRDFIQHNYTPYEGDSNFLEKTTEKTDKLWNEVLELYKKEHESEGGVLDIDTKTISTVSAHDAGYIDKDLEEIVGLQTDKPLKELGTPNYSLGKAFSFITLTLGPLRFSSRGPRRLP